jgi:transcription-repair coupling factor (superfamily II helicase)
VQGVVSRTVSTATSLSVRALLNSAIARTDLTGRARAYSGLTPPAKALAVAAAAHAQRDALWLYVVPSDPEIEQATNDVRFFLAALEAIADTVIERVVLPFPSYQVDPYRGLAPHFQVTSSRARALHAAALGTARVIVASAPALMPRLPAVESILTTSVDVRPGVEIEPQGLAETLVAGGYERQDPVDEHGEFSLRGGILDVFPAGEASPIRIEFIGDSVESIRRFDPSTQRSIETLDQFQIVPVRETSGADPASPQALTASVFEYLRASRTSRVIVAEPADVRTAIDKWSEQVAASFEQRTTSAEKRPPQELLSWRSTHERAVTKF